MAISQRLGLRQSQALVMTPQLQQSIKLLQLSNIELSTFVEAELERNPLLEREEGERDDDGGDGTGDRIDIEPPDSESGRPVAADVALTAPEPPAIVSTDAPLDTDWSNLFTGSSATDRNEDYGGEAQFAGAGRGRTDFADDLPGLEETLAERLSLRDHLLSQIAIEIPGPADRLIAARLVDLLEETGYLGVSVEEVAAGLGCPPERVEAVLRRCQRLDPPGIFARSLAECLAIQLAERNRLDPAMQTLLDHLDLLARRDLPAVMRLCGVDAEDLAEMIAEIRALDPKPGAAFDHEVAQTLIPDILMRPQPEGGWVVELNADTLPRVLVNRRYHAEISRGTRSKVERDYVGTCLADANWLVRALDQRANTILKVASEIVRRQDAFFVRGVQHLKPLTLKDVAEAVDMHESTISRVTTNKVIATPRGVFELKYFFTQAIQGADGADAHSAEAVRHRIKSLIDAEPADAILSDDRIVEILRGEGIDIARRTVAKYREGMRIPSSVQRRREKGLSR
ncbi:RNA polymerase factor sigma-54 [Inquilinus limosus]|uniref:RNA polymerase factor sigma-54 n=1 Tax=Inquilinus limosus TaxID=171674 RepID=UPI0003F61F57|nr:RNA polymerase factor sigma-54 [Inquilinus limosus]